MNDRRDSHAAPIGVDGGKRLALLLGLVMQLVLIGVGLWPAAALMMRYASIAEHAWQWVLLILAAVLVFNFCYLVALLGLRMLIPYPPEGRFELGPGRRPPRAAVLFMLNMLLVKARYETPWAPIFSAVLTRIMPLRPFYTRHFGPHTQSATLGDTLVFTDPWYVEAGRGVQFGGQAFVCCHYFDNRGLCIKRIRIGDHAVIGGGAMILAGAEIGEHAVIAARSLVPPDTRIGPHEYWAGSPAKFVKSLATGNDAADS